MQFVEVVPDRPPYMHPDNHRWGQVAPGPTNRVTGGGISSGLDEAFKLVELLAGYGVAQEVQRVTQYYPAPPVVSTLPEAEGCPLDKTA